MCANRGQHIILFQGGTMDYSRQQRSEYNIISKDTPGNRLALGTFLRVLRIQKGRTLKEVEEKTGVPKSSLSNLEIGQSMPTAERLELLCSFYSIDPKDINSLYFKKKLTRKKRRTFPELYIKKPTCTQPSTEEKVKSQLDGDNILGEILWNLLHTNECVSSIKNSMKELIALLRGENDL
jgi:transcriptional regulator with XRE-family HTH domain